MEKNEYEEMLEEVEEDITDVIEKNKLISIINDSKLLNESQKMKYRSLANMFNAQFKKNLNRTSLDLSDEYAAVGPDIWLEFINFPEVRLYLDSFRTEELARNIDAQIMAGSNVTGNVKMKQMLKRDMQLDNSNIIIVRLPEKEDRTYAEQIV